VLSIQSLGEDIYGFDPTVDQLKISPVLKSQLNLDTVTYQDGVISANLKDGNKPVELAYLEGNPEVDQLKSVLQLEPRLQSSPVKRFFGVDITNASTITKPPENAITDIVVELTNDLIDHTYDPDYTDGGKLRADQIALAAKGAYDDADSSGGNTSNKVLLKYNVKDGTLSYVEGNQDWREYLTQNMNIHIVGAQENDGSQVLKPLVNKLLLGGTAGQSSEGSPSRIGKIEIQGVNLNEHPSDVPYNYLNALQNSFVSDKDGLPPVNFDVGSYVTMPLTWYEDNQLKFYGTTNYTYEGTVYTPGGIQLIKTPFNNDQFTDATGFYNTDVLYYDTSIGSYLNVTQKTTNFVSKQVNGYLHWKQTGFADTPEGKDLKKVWQNAGSTKKLQASAKSLGFANSGLKLTDGIIKLFDGDSSNDLGAAINVVTGALDGVHNFREALDAIVNATGNPKYLEQFRKAVNDDLKTSSLQKGLKGTSTAIGASYGFYKGVKSVASGENVFGGVLQMAGSLNSAFETAVKLRPKVPGKSLSKYLKYSGYVGPIIATIKLGLAINNTIKAKAEYQNRQLDFLNSEIEAIYNELAPQLKEAGFDDLWLSYAFNGDSNVGKNRANSLVLNSYYPKQQWADNHGTKEDSLLTSLNIFVQLLKNFHNIKTEGQIAAESSPYISQFSNGNNLERQFLGMNLETDAQGIPVQIPINSITDTRMTDRNMAIYSLDGTDNEVITGNGDNEIAIGSDGNLDPAKGLAKK